MGMVVQHNLISNECKPSVRKLHQVHSQSQQRSYHQVTELTVQAMMLQDLKISEKMRSQIRGLNKASSNAQDGVSLIQTAEGALNETHSILQRMNELS